MATTTATPLHSSPSIKRLQSAHTSSETRWSALQDHLKLLSREVEDELDIAKIESSFPDIDDVAYTVESVIVGEAGEESRAIFSSPSSPHEASTVAHLPSLEVAHSSTTTSKVSTSAISTQTKSNDDNVVRDSGLRGAVKHSGAQTIATITACSECNTVTEINAAGSAQSCANLSAAASAATLGKGEGDTIEPTVALNQSGESAQRTERVAESSGDVHHTSRSSTSSSPEEEEEVLSAEEQRLAEGLQTLAERVELLQGELEEARLEKEIHRLMYEEQREIARRWAAKSHSNGGNGGTGVAESGAGTHYESVGGEETQHYAAGDNNVASETRRTATITLEIGDDLLHRSAHRADDDRHFVETQHHHAIRGPPTPNRVPLPQQLSPLPSDGVPSASRVSNAVSDRKHLLGHGSADKATSESNQNGGGAATACSSARTGSPRLMSPCADDVIEPAEPSLMGFSSLKKAKQGRSPSASHTPQQPPLHHYGTSSSHQQQQRPQPFLERLNDAAGDADDELRNAPASSEHVGNSREMYL